jgi:hypothetical protein
MNVKGKLEWATFYYLCGLKWLRERGEPTGRGVGATGNADTIQILLVL